MQSLLIRTDLNNLSRSNVIRCFDVPSIIINDEKKKLQSVKAFKSVLDFVQGCRHKSFAQNESDCAYSNGVSSCISSISKTRQSSSFCTV